MQFVRGRLLTLAVCGFCLVAAGVVFQMRASGTGARSTLGALACALALLAGVGGGGLAVLPNRVWMAMHDAARQWLVRLAEADSSSMSARIAISLVICSGGAFVLIVVHLAPLQVLDHNSDQFAYLQTSTEIQRAGGVGSLARDMFTGRFVEANRHPLYLALLSLRPTPTFGQSLSSLFGLLTLCGLAALVMRKFGSATAAVCCTLFATNFGCDYASTLVTCESLLVLLATVGWLWFGLPRQDDMVVDRVGSGRSLTAGGWLGLMYLTKGTGLLWLAGYCCSLVLSCRNTKSATTDAPTSGLSQVPGAQKQLVQKPLNHCGQPSGVASSWLGRVLLCLVLVVVGWAVVSSPLLIRNALRYGSPTYNVNSWLLFVDEYTDPEALTNSMTLSTAAQRYWHEHSIGQIVKRGALGLVWEIFILVRSLGPAPLQESRVLFGAPLLGLALLGMAVQRRVDVKLLPLWLVICLPIFGWYVPVAAGERFILPLVPPLLVFASVGIVRLAQLWWRERASTVLAVVCLAWLIVWTTATLRLTELP